jgi:hypothetical protein
VVVVGIKLGAFFVKGGELGFFQPAGTHSTASKLLVYMSQLK